MQKLYDNPFSVEATEAWKQMKSKLKRGDVISGKVVKHFPYGAFVDAGLGFLVFLDVIEFDSTIRKPYKFPDDYPILNSEITGQLTVFNEDNRQIRITQRYEEHVNEWPDWKTGI